MEGGEPGISGRLRLLEVRREGLNRRARQQHPPTLHHHEHARGARRGRTHWRRRARGALLRGQAFRVGHPRRLGASHRPEASLPTTEQRKDSRARRPKPSRRRAKPGPKSAAQRAPRASGAPSARSSSGRWLLRPKTPFGTSPRTSSAKAQRGRRSRWWRRSPLSSSGTTSADRIASRTKSRPWSARLQESPAPRPWRVSLRPWQNRRMMPSSPTPSRPSKSASSPTTPRCSKTSLDAPGERPGRARPPKRPRCSKTAVARCVNVINQHLPPQPPHAPLQKPLEPTPDQVAASQRCIEAVSNPSSILRLAASGLLTPDVVGAVQASHPAQFQAIQQALLTKLAGHKEAIPYTQRQMISLIMGRDMDGTQTPAMIQASQVAAHQPPPANSGAGQAPKSSVSGLGKITLSNRFLTPAQASASRE